MLLNKPGLRDLNDVLERVTRVRDEATPPFTPQGGVRTGVESLELEIFLRPAKISMVCGRLFEWFDMELEKHTGTATS